jgi:hypothetical protein
MPATVVRTHGWRTRGAALAARSPPAPVLVHLPLVRVAQSPAPQQAMASRTIVYTPKVHNTPRIVDKEITFLHERLSRGIEWNSRPRRSSPS